MRGSDRPKSQAERLIERRHAVVRYYVHGTSISSIAIKLEVSRDTVERDLAKWRDEHADLPRVVRRRFDQMDQLLEQALYDGDLDIIRSIAQVWTRTASLLGDLPAPPPSEGTLAEVLAEEREYLDAIRREQEDV